MRRGEEYMGEILLRMDVERRRGKGRPKQRWTESIKHNQSRVLVLEYKYKYSGFLRNVLKYIPSTSQIVLKYRCT